MTDKFGNKLEIGDYVNIIDNYIGDNLAAGKIIEIYNQPNIDEAFEDYFVSFNETASIKVNSANINYYLTRNSDDLEKITDKNKILLYQLENL